MTLQSKNHPFAGIKAGHAHVIHALRDNKTSVSQRVTTNPVYIKCTFNNHGDDDSFTYWRGVIINLIDNCQYYGMRYELLGNPDGTIEFRVIYPDHIDGGGMFDHLYSLMESNKAEHGIPFTKVY